MFKFFVLVVAVIVIVWYFAKGKSRRAHRLINESSGTFDDKAQKSLRLFDSIARPTAQDYFQRANIVRYNIMQNEPMPPAAHARVHDDYINAVNLLSSDDNVDFIAAQVTSFGMNPPMLNAVKAAAVRKKAKSARKFGDGLTAAIQYTNDAQNVHDTKVSKYLRETFRKINAKRPSWDICRAEIISLVPPERIERVERVLNTIDLNNYISTIGAYEIDVVCAVWGRAALNATCNQIKQAVIDALVDCVENNNVVCINGRVGRIINSLALLDFDPSISQHGAMTLEAYRNQIFHETKVIVDGAIDAANEPVRKYYLENGPETQDIKPFREDLRKRIDKNLEKYDDKLTPVEIDTVRAECYIYVDV